MTCSLKALPDKERRFIDQKGVVFLLCGFVLALCLIFAAKGIGRTPLGAQEQGKFIEKHEVNDLVMMCMDHRFRLMEDVWINNNCGNDADIIAWPGCTKCLDPGNHLLEEAALDVIGLAIEKHKVQTVHLIHHLDCGGYGGSGKHSDEAAERKFHTEELHRAVRIIQGRYSRVNVRIYLASPKSIDEIQ